MTSPYPRSRASLGGHALHPMLVPAPIVCFVGTFIADIAYAVTANMQWANFSAWLLTAGLVVALFAAIAALVDFFGEPRIRRLRAAWIHGLGNAVVLALSIVNALVHTRDAYTSVTPWGLALSTAVVAILPFTSWFGWGLVQRHGVGVRPEKQP